jgi:hypothetical protein
VESLPSDAQDPAKMTPTEPLVPPQTSGRFGPREAFALAAAIALGFALFTDQRWEDYYITFRVSKNLAAGLGLVFQSGERVHAFTSPLGVLLPAVISWVTGAQSDELALWIFRLVTISAFSGAVATVWSIGRRLGWARASCAIAAGLLMTDAKSVSFSINGMETAFVLLFLALAIHALVAGSSAWRLGCIWAALMWTRPDGFVFFGAIGLGWWLFAPNASASGGRKDLALKYLKAGSVCAAFYLPWFLWAWSYFGSPVPHTVVAKAIGNHPPDWPALLWQLVTLPIRAWGFGKWDFILMPAYALDYGGWPLFAALIGHALVAFALVAFVLPRVDRSIRALAVALAFAVFYLLNVQLFPWYLPPATLLVILILAGIIEAGRRTARRPSVPLTLGAAAVVFSGSLLLGNAWQIRQQQRIIEGQRKAIGVWLRAHRSTPNDTVFLEPLGYIGYFSQLKMFDYPGLASPEVVGARRKFGEDRLKLVAALEPRWVVQRPGELQSVDPALTSWFLGHYAPAKLFDVSAEIAAVKFLPGRPYLQFDQGFLIWRKKD